jgi:DNA-binding NarL/FixJ family response regulator
MTRTRSQRPVMGRASRSLCRIGLRGDLAFVDRVTSALAGSRIEVARVEQPGRKPSRKAFAAQHVNALVASISSDEDGESEAGQLCEELPGMPIIAVVDAIGEGTVRTMLRAGVRGIVLGHELEGALAPTVRATQVGQIAIPRSGRHQVFRPVLSHRENTVLAMVSLGRSNGQIAANLHIEESTVKSHLRSLFAKLGVRSREEATAAVFDGASQIPPGVMAVTDQHPRPENRKPTRRRKPPSKRPIS